MNEPKHPLQPIVKDKDGTLRFKENAIVRFLLEDGPNDMNRLGRIPFSQEDREQFAQLIGYSVGGALSLPYMSDETASAICEARNAFKETTTNE
jgi:hypothetical protein